MNVSHFVVVVVVVEHCTILYRQYKNDTCTYVCASEFDAHFSITINSLGDRKEGHCRMNADSHAQ